MSQLFDAEPEKSEHADTCKDCIHRQSWNCNSKVFQYCGIRKSNRTNNGLLKIKCKNYACPLFEKLNQKDL